MGYRDVVLADRPVGFWRFEDTMGWTVAHDLSGKGHDAAYDSGYTQGVVGPEAAEKHCAVHLAGSGDASPGLIAIPNAAIASVLTGDHTIEVWFRPTITPTGYEILSAANGSGWTNPVNVQFGSGNLRLYWGAGTGSETKILEAAAPISAGKWAQVIATAAGTRGSLYVNGVLLSTTTSAQSRTDGGFTLRVGLRQDSGNAGERGDYADLSIYDRALSPARILAHYRAQLGAGWRSPDRRRGRAA